MALIDKASLLMVPSTYEDGTLYNVLPSGNKAPDETGNHNGYDQTRADFTFSRGSNLSATRIGPSGLIEKGRENVLLQSNSFDTTWSSINTTEASGQSGYDGTNDAWLLTKSAASARVQQSISQSGVQTYSVYAKAGTLDFVMLNNGTVSQWYDLSNGTIGTNSSSANTIDANIEDIGNGWYRCSLTFNSSITVVRIYPSQADNDVSGTSGNIYIQDAQLEKGLVSTPYIETGATTAQAGILEDMPRINYDANGENGALLLEPSRTNILENSEYILGSDWNQLGGALTIAQNTSDTLSPEGKYNAGKITLSSATNRYFASKGYNLGGLNNVSGSVYLKSDGADITGKLAFFNGTAGDVITITNEWQRFEINKTAANSTEYFGLDFRGSGHSTSGVVYCYGWQLENNSTYVSSYIPTHGAAVTRASDGTPLTPANTFSSLSSFTWFFELSRNGFGSDTAQDAMTLRNAAGTEQIRIHFETPSKQIRFRDALNSYATIGTNHTLTANESVKCCLVSDGTDMKAFFNGSQSGSDYTIVTQPDVDRVYLNSKGFQLSELIVFDEALSDAECVTLTTL